MDSIIHIGDDIYYKKEGAHSTVQGVVVGFSESYNNRFHVWTVPGIHWNTFYPIIKVGDMEVHVQSLELTLVDQELSEHRKKFRIFQETFVRDLPDLHVWEYDIVSLSVDSYAFKTLKAYGQEGKASRMVIANIGHHQREWVYNDVGS
jgi:hypothetical protein